MLSSHGCHQWRYKYILCIWSPSLCCIYQKIKKAPVSVHSEERINLGFCISRPYQQFCGSVTLGVSMGRKHVYLAAQFGQFVWTLSVETVKILRAIWTAANVNHSIGSECLNLLMHSVLARNTEEVLPTRTEHGWDALNCFETRKVWLQFRGFLCWVLHHTYVRSGRCTVQQM